MINCCVTLPNHAYAVLAIPAKLRIETIRRRPPNTTCTPKHACSVGEFVVTNSYITIAHDTTQKNMYTMTTPTSQDTNRYNTKIQITAESEIVSEYGQDSNRLRVLKINDGVHTLPRPSRKGNLANVIKHIPATKATEAKKKRGRSM